MSKPVTMRVVAEEAGVSQPTVSQVLSGKWENLRICEATQRRVRETAQRLRYRPNAHARAVRRGRFGAAGLLRSVDGHFSHMPEGLVVGIERKLSENGLHLMIGAWPDEKLVDATAVPRILSEWSVDVLLINYHFRFPPQLETLVSECRVPSVWINSKHESDCVYLDDLGGGRAATEHLLALGHRRITYADFSYGFDRRALWHYSALDREAGYRAAMDARQLTRRVLRWDVWHPARDRVDAAMAALKGPDRPTAVVAYSDRSAGPFVLAAARLGLQVPGDFSVVTLGEDVFVDLGQSVTTFVADQQEFGRAVGGAAVEKLARPDRPLAPRVVPYVLTETGDTCAPPA
jgi:LacI family transcriptional regulator